MSYVPSLKPEAIVERQSWLYRAIALLHGNKSKLGALVIAIAGRKVNAPCFHPGGMKIKRDGSIMALYNDGSGFKARVVCHTVDELNDMFRGLAAELKMDEAQREDMFAELRKFCIKDERVTSNLDGGVNYRKGRN